MKQINCVTELNLQQEFEYQVIDQNLEDKSEKLG